MAAAAGTEIRFILNKTDDRVREAMESRIDGREGLMGYVSSDGVHWKLISEDPIVRPTLPNHFDSQNVMFWSTIEQMYVLYARYAAGADPLKTYDILSATLGYLGPEDRLLNQLGVERDARSNVRAEYGCFATTIEGVFAAGDMRRGQSLVVWAINEGRGAARECDRHLMGETSLP